MREIRHQSRADDVPYKRRISNGTQTEHKPDTQPESNGSQTVVKPESNGSQSADKVETNWRQSADKVETNWRQSRDKVETNWRQSRDKVESQLETEVETNWRQSEDKVETNLKILGLPDTQLKILDFIYEASKKSRSKITDPISISYFSESIKTPFKSLKKMIQRLEKSGYLKRVTFKDGRAGWTTYSLPRSIFEQLLHRETEDKVRTNWRQSRDKVESQLETQPETGHSSSSSSNKLTTTTSEQTFDDAWRQIDFTPLARFGFSETHLIQLAQQSRLTAQQVQDSIDAFAFDLEENKKAKELKSSPVNFFMGILRKGLPYTPPENYESPMDQHWREYNSAMQAREKKKSEVIQKTKDLEFGEWKASLSEDWIRLNLPKLVHERGPAQDAEIRKFFVENVWPTKFAQLSEKFRQKIM